MLLRSQASARKAIPCTAAVDSQSTSPICDLPEELIRMIAECLVPDPDQTWRRFNDYESLRHLRLVSRFFGSSQGIKATLFHSIPLVASPKHVRRLEVGKDDLSWLARYVRHISFQPSQYSWDMSLEDFEEIACLCALNKYCEEYDVEPGLIACMGTAHFVEEYFIGRFPVDHEVVTREFKEYSKHARRAENLHVGSRLTDAWVMAIQRLSNATKFRIGFWNYDGDEDDNDPGGPHTHTAGWSDAHTEATCRQIHEPPGEGLINAAMISLGQAKTVIEHLDISHVEDPFYAWADKGPLDALDLSRLHTLIFSPRCFEQDEFEAAGQVVAIDASEKCGAVLRKILFACASSIRHLDIIPQFDGNYSSAEFPMPESPPMPQLTYLAMTGHINCKPLANLVSQCKSLKYFYLHPDFGTEDWRPLWRAIRYHQNRIQLDLFEFPLEEWDITLNHNTGHAFDLDTTDGEYPDEYESFAKYLSNTGRWDEQCRYLSTGDDERSLDDESEAESEGPFEEEPIDWAEVADCLPLDCPPRRGYRHI